MALINGETVRIPQEQEREWKAWRDRRVGWAWHGCAQEFMSKLGYYGTQGDEKPGEDLDRLHRICMTGRQHNGL
jgi:hypothetical protein